MEDLKKSRVYVGSYADGDSESIFLYQLDPRTGELHREKGFKGGEKTSYMTFDEQRHYLYVVNKQEWYKGKASGAVCAFSVDPQTGFLSFMNRVPSLGSEPVHVTLDQKGKQLLWQIIKVAI